MHQLLCWDYKLHKGSGDATGDVGLAIPRPLAVAPAPTLPGAAKPTTLRRPGATWLLEEKERPGEYMPIEEDAHGSYILNSKDLRAIEYVSRLTEIGIDSLKIEGRTEIAVKNRFSVGNRIGVIRTRDNLGLIIEAMRKPLRVCESFVHMTG